jgi:hypothetical protein
MPHHKAFKVFLIYFSKCPKFQHHTMLCSKCSTLQVSSLNVSQIFWWKVFSLLDAAFSMANLDLICIICYHATQTVEIFHILQLFFDLTYSVLWMVPCRLSWPWFFPHALTFHSIFQFQLVYQSCPVAPFLPQPVAQRHLHISLLITWPSVLQLPSPLTASRSNALPIYLLLV